MGVVGLDSARSRHQRRAQGAFFTPKPLVQFVVDQALDAWFASQKLCWHQDGYPLLRILDPSAGDGRFLECAAQGLLRRATEAGHCGGTRMAAVESAIRKHCLLAVERDPDYAARIAQELGDEVLVHCEEALLSGVVADGSVDLVIGNPPYLRSIQLGQVDEALREKLRGTYTATSYREWDLYAAFLEQGLRWLRPGGQLAFVMPSRWWTAQWATPMRRQLCEQGAVRALVDFGATQIFESATVYSSLCFASSEASNSLEVARFREGQWQTGSLEASELGAGEPWNLCIGKARTILRDVCAQGPALGQVARIKKGAGTNADSVFVIDDAEADVEAALLRPLLRGRDIVAFADVPNWPRVLVPYDREGKLISPVAMQRRYPRALAYLSHHRDVLEAREKRRFAGEKFYCYGRPQNMAFLGQDRAKIVVPDVTKEGRALIDTSSAMVLDSAYAIRAESGSGYDLASLCGILNSRIVALWLAQHGVPLRGGYTRMKTAYLKGLPLPPQGHLLDAISASVRLGATPGEVDEIVRRAYAIERDDWS